MPLRTKLFIIIGVIVLIILSISMFFLVGAEKIKEKIDPSASTPALTDTNSSQSTQTNVDQQVGQTVNDVDVSKVEIKKLTSEETEKNGVRQLARIFTERYGSYSTDSNFQNVKDLESLSTNDLWQVLKAKIGTTQNGSEYLGMSTKVVSMKLTKWGASSAQVDLDTLRKEEKSGGAITSKNQSITVYLVKTSGKWLVDDVKWE